MTGKFQKMFLTILRKNKEIFQIPFFYLGSEIHLKKADHVRLQYLNIGYRFQNNRKNQLWKSASLNINASNLGILWRANKDGIDPDYVESISPSKQLSLGIKLML